MLRHARTVVLVAVSAVGPGCTGQSPEPSRELSVSSVRQAVIDCTPWTDTGYVSGNPFEITLVKVDGEPVEVHTANAYYVMQQEAASGNVAIEIVSGFRTQAEQQYLYNCYKNCNCNNCNLAAAPGYSNHQSGHALDLNTSESGVLSWLNAHGAGFGFSRTVQSENWHWEWWGGGPGGGPCTAGSGGGGGSGGQPQPCTSEPLPGGENSVFQDMPPGTFGLEEATLLKNEGIASGCQASPPLFCPGCHLTRAQMVTFLVRASKLPLQNPAQATFSDVPTSSTYYSYVETAAANGITQGCSSTEFCPDSPVTRAQAAAFLRRTLNWAKVTPATPSFEDVPSTHLFYGDIEALKANCVTQGCSATQYCPEQPVTRAQAAVLLVRAFDLGDSNPCLGSGGAGGTAGAGGASGQAGSSGGMPTGGSPGQGGAGQGGSSNQGGNPGQGGSGGQGNSAGQGGNTPQGGASNGQPDSGGTASHLGGAGGAPPGAAVPSSSDSGGCASRKPVQQSGAPASLAMLLALLLWGRRARIQR